MIVILIVVIGCYQHDVVLNAGWLRKTAVKFAADRFVLSRYALVKFASDRLAEVRDARQVRSGRVRVRKLCVIQTRAA